MDTIIEPVIQHPKRGAYRRHTIAFKRMVVEHSSRAGASVSRVAREHDVNANQVFAWRKLFREGLLGTAMDQSSEMLPVVLTQAAPAMQPGRVREPALAPVGVIRLELGEMQLRIEGAVDASALTLVLGHLLR